ncbi:MAG: hypothetical protein ACLGIN_03080, partial [Candidatus Sericytochromatia bacterium]
MSRPALTSSPPALTRPAPAGLRRALQGARGREMFGRPAGPWGAMFAPVPLVGAALLLCRQLLIAAGVAPWVVNLVGEVGWLCFMPFVMATGGQAIARARSDDRWRESEGEHHLDYSPRRWHYGLALAIAAMPIALLQLWPRALELYLGVSLWLRTGLGLAGAGHVGYNPGPLHLLALLTAPAVLWQADRLIRLVPCGRLLGLQRELARLRGAVAWEPAPWGGPRRRALRRLVFRPLARPGPGRPGEREAPAAASPLGRAAPGGGGELHLAPAGPAARQPGPARLPPRAAVTAPSTGVG